MSLYSTNSARNRRTTYLQQASHAGTTVMRLPLPLGGWNLRDSPATMPASDALIMDNIIPENGVLRGVVHSNFGGGSMSANCSGNPLDFVAYYPKSSSDAIQFVSITDQSIQIWVSASGSVSNKGKFSQWPAHMYSKMVNRTVYISDLSGSFNPSQWSFSGGQFAATSMSSSAAIDHSSNLEMIGPAIFKGRGYWWKNRVNPTSYMWYSKDAIGAVAGDFHRYDFSNYADGTVLAITRWTQDGGAGPDDYLVVLFDTGAVLVYQGIWPEDIDGWTIIGSYRIPRPLSPNAVLEVGGRIFVATDQDYIVLPDALIGGGAVVQESKVARRVRELATNSPLRKLWQARFFANKGWIVVKAPLSSTNSELHVRTREGAWFRITDSSAISIADINGRMFFMKTNPNSFIYELQSTAALHQNGDQIGWPVVKTRWDTLGTRQQKLLTGIRAQLWASASAPDTPANVCYAVHADYDETAATATVSGSQLWPVNATGSASGSVNSNSWLSGYARGQELSILLKLKGHKQSHVEIRGLDALVSPLGEIA